MFKKKFPSQILLTLLTFGVIVAFSACSSGSDSNEGSNDQGLGSLEGEFLSQCGTVIGGDLANPVLAENGIPVQIIEVAGPNRLIVQREQGPQLVFLNGLSNTVNTVEESRARAYLQTRLGNAVLFESEIDCTQTFQGQIGIVGMLFMVDTGENLTEELLLRGAARPSLSSSCGGSVISSCYDSIARETVVEVGARVSNFLWKPNAERDNNLVVLLNPFAPRVIINGTIELLQSGASNGRATTARGSSSGCSYGTNITIEAFDSAGRPLVWPGDELSFVIANGCNRVEF